MEPEEPCTLTNNAVEQSHSSPITSAISAIEGIMDTNTIRGRIARIGDWLAGAGSDHSDEESVKSLDLDDGYDWVDLMEGFRNLRRKDQGAQPEDTVETVRRRKDEKLVSTPLPAVNVKVCH